MECALSATQFWTFIQEHYLTISPPALPPLQAIWLNYSRHRPFSCGKLQSCDHWGDLGAIFGGGVFSRGGPSTLGMIINYSDTGEIWEDSAVDWVVAGVSSLARRNGFSVHTHKILTFRVGCPRAVAIFGVQSDAAPVVPAETVAASPWIERDN